MRRLSWQHKTAGCTPTLQEKQALGDDASGYACCFSVTSKVPQTSGYQLPIPVKVGRKKSRLDNS